MKILIISCIGYYGSDLSCRPIYFVQYHESPSHMNVCPHKHWIDCREANIESVFKGGDFN